MKNNTNAFFIIIKFINLKDNKYILNTMHNILVIPIY